jgi:hypothetical protein
MPKGLDAEQQPDAIGPATSYAEDVIRPFGVSSR